LSFISEYEKRPDSIFRYYSIENEAAFLGRATALKDQERRYYVGENVKRFLGEYVAKLPFSHISYHLGGGGFAFAGMPVTASYAKAAELGETREQAELTGFLEVENQMREHPRSMSFWLSPPKTADYGFVFALAPDKTAPEGSGMVKEYIIRYPERKGELAMSSSIWTSLSSAPSPEDTNKYIETPISASVPDARQAVDDVLAVIGIQKTDLERAHLFEEATDAILGKWIRQYTDAITTLSRLEKTFPYYQIAATECKALLLAIYNRAEEIQALDTDSLKRMIHPETPSDDREPAMYYALHNRPSITSGSCPVIDSSDDLARELTNDAVYGKLDRGVPVESSLHKNTEKTLHCTCPFCNKEVDAKIADGKIQCPKCHKHAPYAC